MKVTRTENEMTLLALAAGIILHVSKSRKKVETDKLAGMLKVGKKFVTFCKEDLVPDDFQDLYVTLAKCEEICKKYEDYTSDHVERSRKTKRLAALAEELGFAVVDKATGEDIKTHRQVRNPTLFTQQ